MMNRLLNSHAQVLGWLQKRLTERQFFILASILIGFTAGLAAVVLKMLVHYIHAVITENHHLPFQYSLYLIFPLLGLLITVWYVRRFHSGTLDKSTAFVLYSIHRKSSLLAPFHMAAHIITSAITIGFGGSSGLEAPIATTGAAIGSNFSRTYRLTYRERTLLLCCGAAAGIAAAFNAPIAGVLFAIEILLVDLSASAFIPLIIAAAVGALCSAMLLQDGIVLSFKTQQPFNFENVPYYLLLSLLAGLMAVYHSRVFLAFDAWFDRFNGAYTKALIGGAILALLIYLFPPLFGEGYDSIITLSVSNAEQFLQNSPFEPVANNAWLVLVFTGLIALAKTLATSATLSGGGNGGNFAPSLMVGAFTGFFFARVINLTGMGHVPESNFTLVAMAGVMSGVMHAPLTAIFLIAEVTGGYALMIPLMIVASLSYTIVKFLAPQSIDAVKLERKGQPLLQERDQRILHSLNLGALVETNFQPVNENARFREMIPAIERSTRNIFPVTDDAGKLVGIIHLDNIREIMFHQELYDTLSIKELTSKVPAVIDEKESMDDVMRKFDSTDAWNLPVVRDGIYLGFISKSAIFNKYRSVLIEKSMH